MKTDSKRWKEEKGEIDETRNKNEEQQVIERSRSDSDCSVTAPRDDGLRAEMPSVRIIVADEKIR